MNPIGSLNRPGRATVEGRVRAVEIRPVEQNSVLAAEIVDSTGEPDRAVLRPVAHPGHHLRRPGAVPWPGRPARGRRPVMINPAYELLFPGTGDPGDAGRPAGAAAGHLTGETGLTGRTPRGTG